MTTVMAHHDQPVEVVGSATPSATSPPPLSATLGAPAAPGLPLSLKDYEPLARRRLPRALFGYISGACEDNCSMTGNRAALQRLLLVTRVLRDVSSRDFSRTLFGRTWAAPFGIAPMGLSAMMAYRGDTMLARAARAERIPMIMSSTSLVPLEEVASAAPGSWYQAYLPADHDWIEPMVGRISRAGYETLVLTVDVPVNANRENLVKCGFTIPLRPSLRLAFDGISHPVWLTKVFARTLLRHGMPRFVNAKPSGGEPILSRHVDREFGQRDRLTWGSVAEIRRRWKGNLVIKGILHPEDAKLARAAGVDGIIVSNHGGRQLDSAIASLDALPRVLDAAGTMPVMIDGGFRRGSEVMKALALGAQMVFIGRPFLYAAAVGGEEGVAHAIRLVKAEIDRNMAMMGVSTIGELNRDFLHAVV
ncbi:alpha-hydroxy acid oxidase [Sphingobium quisquiliarum]|nr:alpha-hydroxy acid oxidase [Sphingobium quisquiliarum]